jgi:fused signal recognition particle receptor
MFGFLKKTKEAISGVIAKKEKKISKELLEEILLEADVSYEVVENAIFYLPAGDMVEKKDIKRVLLTYFRDIEKSEKKDAKPFVELIFGINGAGKTTTIAKLANYYKKQGKKVMLSASDTFRAAAVEQLKRWATKLDIPIVASKQGADPSAVAYDAISSAVAKEFDYVLIDTAGRLHNHQNLSNELQKIVRISSKAKEGAPHRKILVIDGTQGNSAIHQAIEFNKIVPIDGLIITKLNGTAKGGALFSIAYELKKPILFIGTGESADDLVEFDKEQFVEDLLGEIFLSE